MSKLVASTPFINVSIKVRPGSAPGTYKVESAPTTLVVSQPDTVINYQIVDSGEHKIVFNKKNPLTVVPPDNNQLSPASVGFSGKLVTINDANSAPMILNINLNFVDEQGIEFSHDPEVENKPEA
jgi:hypothetical protein